MLKKQLIMDNALELFAMQGFEATSVQQITEHCGISKGAFYLSFKSKDELIVAIIDHFMSQIISDVDQLVRNKDEKQNLLFNFYYVNFQSFEKHMDFAKILMKEYTQSLNEKLILKMRYYDKLLNAAILSMIDCIYGEKVYSTKYDLLFCIKGFLRTYSELFLYQSLPLDLNHLCQSLVEKTHILANGISTPFVTTDLMDLSDSHMQDDTTQNQITTMIDEKVKEMEDSIEKESLLLLKEQLLEQTYSAAIVKGLIENIRTHPHCKWVAYLLDRHFGL